MEPPDNNDGADELIRVHGDAKLGDMRKLINSESELLRRHGVHVDPELTKNEYFLIVVAHVLIVVSAIARFSITITLPELPHALPLEDDKDSWEFSMMEMEMEESGSEGLINCSNKTEEYALRWLMVHKKRHVLLSTVVAMFILPHLFLLGLVPEGRMSLFLQMVMSIATIVLSIFNFRYQRGLLDTFHLCSSHTRFQNWTTCTGRKSCNHKHSSWLLLITIGFFVITTILRILFRTKIKNLIIGIRILGPVVELGTSRRGRDFQALAMLLFLTYSIISGTVLNMGTKFRYVQDGDVVEGELPFSRLVEVIADTGATLLTVFWLLLLFWIYAQVHHRFTHTLLVEEDLFEEELEQLGEEFHDALIDHEASMYGYHPVSKDPDYPVDSGHNYVGHNHKRTISSDN